ncbi:helix-turn-helix transcriptional regulator [Nocardiopsis composta]|uniref:Putative DNA-binding transcriptional regulator YafY n=1 Tax=Nocardiopsis composta TaxID=157465 RepID=A0A7W8QHK6_9ACTN|nr:WYL domain-containing protein [Nocardiopsis composta]MBB5430169.1 putative DNA-binding transcriptional regulator YafY [Nocardiopsis composta]
MRDPSARLLRLLSLLQTPREWTGAELAERLGTTPRTVRRDIDRLRGLGYPVHGTRGTAGGYRLEAGAAVPPLLLDDDEAVAVALSLRTAEGGAVAGVEEAAPRALAKLERVLPSRLRRRVAALAGAAVVLPQRGPAADPGVLALLASACAAGEALRFGYRSRSGATTRRLVEPHRLVAAGRRWYLVAFDTDRADWRTFRADRVTEPRATGRRVPRRALPGGADPAQWVEQRLASAFDTVRARVLVRAPADRVAEATPASLGAVEPVDDASCLLHTAPDTPEYLAYRIAVLGFEFTLLDPPELAPHLRSLAERTLRAAEGHPPLPDPPA